jgi:hypothetical protein
MRTHRYSSHVLSFPRARRGCRTKRPRGSKQPRATTRTVFVLAPAIPQTQPSLLLLIIAMRIYHFESIPHPLPRPPLLLLVQSSRPSLLNRTAPVSTSTPASTPPLTPSSLVLPEPQSQRLGVPQPQRLVHVRLDEAAARACEEPAEGDAEGGGEEEGEEDEGVVLHACCVGARLSRDDMSCVVCPRLGRERGGFGGLILGADDLPWCCVGRCARYVPV